MVCIVSGTECQAATQFSVSEISCSLSSSLVFCRLWSKRVTLTASSHLDVFPWAVIMPAMVMCLQVRLRPPEERFSGCCSGPGYSWLLSACQVVLDVPPDGCRFHLQGRNRAGAASLSEPRPRNPRGRSL